jgi:acylphosphatase
MTICMSCLVSGQVQGVAFRAAARRQALALGVTGWARNLPDGRVEVLACGEADQVEKLCGWLWRGPPLAHVTDVVCAPTEVSDISGFEIE